MYREFYSNGQIVAMLLRFEERRTNSMEKPQTTDNQLLKVTQQTGTLSVNIIKKSNTISPLTLIKVVAC